MIERCQYSLKGGEDLPVPTFESGGGPIVIAILILGVKKLSDLVMELTVVK